MLKAAVIGDPVSQSLSPKIHNFLLQKYSINGNYKAIEVKKENLSQAIKNLVDEGYQGFNVTIPHKEEVLKLCDHLSQTAKLVGAVNTVIITEDKKLFGHNSDIEGFLNNLKHFQPDFDLKNKTVFLIGAGGAARAVLYGLIKSKVKKIIITNRSKPRAETLIKDFTNFAKEKKCELEFAAMPDFENQLNACDLLVNSTSLGMESGADPQPLIINLNHLPSSAIVYDIVYKPLITDLLKSAQKNNNKIVTGIGMLIYQALIGFEAWFKKRPEALEVGQLVKNYSVF